LAPKGIALTENQLSNLRKLIFGRGKDNRSKPNKDGTKSSSKKRVPEPELPVNDAAITPTEPPESESPTTTNRASLPGHGRLPHSAYTNTLTIPDSNSGDLCPDRCGGRLYRYEPGAMEANLLKWIVNSEITDPLKST